MANIRAKGANAEREIYHALNEIEADVLHIIGRPAPEVGSFQRNQMQTAVGGSDIANPYGLSIEVKRHENLAINTWWAQCVASSKRDGGVPCLLYRQSRQPWKCITLVALGGRTVRAEVSFEDFLELARERVILTLLAQPAGVPA